MTGARFREIADDLREQIALGALGGTGAGDVGGTGALASEAILGQRYRASRMTVRKALELLREQGLVDSRQGAGWFVTAGSIHQQLALGTFRHAASALTGSMVDRRVFHFAFAPAGPAIADLLQVGLDSEVLQCTTVRSVDGEPLDSAAEFVAGPAAQNISRADAAAPGIWHALARAGVEIGTVRQTIAAGIAGPEDHRHLGAAPGSPLLLIRRLALATDGTPIALADHRYLAHRFSLEVEFNGFAAGSADSPPGLRDTGS
jgi:GntR family transcriptional regulator